VEGRYAANDVVDMLGAFGLLKIEDMANPASFVDFTNFTRDACSRVMPALQATDVSARVSSFCDVAMPPQCQSAFIGKKGNNIQRTEMTLTAKLANLGCSGSVRLRVQTGAVRIMLELVPGPSTAALDTKQALDSLVADVRSSLEQLYSLRLQKSRQRRAALQQHRQKEGRQYHDTIRLKRQSRRDLPGAARALALPDVGVDGIGEVTIKRAGCANSGCTVGRRLMKGCQQRNRRMALKQKRCELLRLGIASCAGGADGSWRASRRGTGRMQACQQLLSSAHLSHGLQLSPWIVRTLQNQRGSVRRLYRHLKELAVAAGHFVPDISLPLVAQPKQSRQLRRERKPGRGISADFAAAAKGMFD